MTDLNDLQNMVGRTAVDPDGSKIGTVGQVYLDNDTERPVWVTVRTGLFGSKETFAPLQGSRVDGENLVLAVPKDLVKDAPGVEPDGDTSDDENETLYRHYTGYVAASSGTDHDESRADLDGNRTDLGDRSGIEGRDVSGPTTDDAMTRSEERLDVGTERVETGRARLRKYVVTENVTTTVPVTREEVRIDREPITDSNRGAAMSGGELTEEEHEITLHEERPVVQKETVPVERVRLGTETVADQQQVTEQVRKEQIEHVEGDTDTPRS